MCQFYTYSEYILLYIKHNSKAVLKFSVAKQILFICTDANFQIYIYIISC